MVGDKRRNQTRSSEPKIPTSNILLGRVGPQLFAPLSRPPASSTCCRETTRFGATPQRSTTGYVLMIPIQALTLTEMVFLTLIIKQGDGYPNTKNAGILSLNESDKGHNIIRKSLIELSMRPDNEAALLQAGILFPNYPQLEFVNPAIQEAVEESSKTDFIQKEETPLISRNPTKPVYHYTPLPQGTFMTQPIQEDKTDNETPPSDDNYLYDYVVRDKTSLLDMGRREIREGNIVRGVYHVLLPDRRMQVVHYWSDSTGYHPTITYNHT